MLLPSPALDHAAASWNPRGRPRWSPPLRITLEDSSSQGKRRQHFLDFPGGNDVPFPQVEAVRLLGERCGLLHASAAQEHLGEISECVRTHDEKVGRARACDR